MAIRPDGVTARPSPTWGTVLGLPTAIGALAERLAAALAERLAAVI